MSCPGGSDRCAANMANQAVDDVISTDTVDWRICRDTRIMNQPRRGISTPFSVKNDNYKQLRALFFAGRTHQRRQHSLKGRQMHFSGRFV